LIVVLTAGVGVLAWLYFRAKRELRRFSGIRDLERHTADCEARCDTLLADATRLKDEARATQGQIDAGRLKIAQYQKLLGTFRSAAELHQRIEADKLKARQLMATLGKLERATQLDGLMREQEMTIRSRKIELEQI